MDRACLVGALLLGDFSFWISSAIQESLDGLVRRRNLHPYFSQIVLQIADRFPLSIYRIENEATDARRMFGFSEKRDGIFI